MDSDDRVQATSGPNQVDPVDDSVVETPAAGALIAANLGGANLGLSTSVTSAPAIGAEGEVAAVENTHDAADGGSWNLDVLEQFGSKHRQTGDRGVSADQNELEAGELNS
ncbi:MAG TPA: hypothetical protein VEW94_14315 [Chloroflexia bacterium]|nr:hypothetical protein [Chloroflexia bacterium]